MLYSCFVESCEDDSLFITMNSLLLLYETAITNTPVQQQQTYQTAKQMHDFGRLFKFTK